MTAARSDDQGLPDGIDPDPAARAALYTLLARAFDHPDEAFAEAAESGALAAEIAQYLDRSSLSVDVPPVETDDDYQALSARYNQLFTLGHAEYTDRSDGSLDAEGPPVPLYETRYRDATWQDVNSDLARAYEYFGVGVDDQQRDHHDNIRLEFEFAAYLARREATGETDAALARRDFLDRHLDPFTDALADRLADVEREFYTSLATLAHRIVRADIDALPERGGDDE